MAKLNTSDNLLICCGCGAQYETTEEQGKDECRICNDPRQFIPPTGQKFTTLRKLREEGYKNTFQQTERDEKVWEIWTEPKFAIGQCARLITTPQGNILYDLVAYLDQDTVDKILSFGPLLFIVISHPHFYTTWADWSATFGCPVYASGVDSEWMNRKQHPAATLRHLTDTKTELTEGGVEGVTAYICGGHFPGSLVLNTLPPATTLPSLFVADTIFSVAAAQNPPPFNAKAGDGKVSYAFLWSIPNSIPLNADEILRIWRVLKELEFKVTYGVMAKVSTVYELEEEGEEGGLKRRVLESAKVVVRRMVGDKGVHEILEETM